ncbi:MBL fold metallo-hydrolase [Actinomyces capricornis]|uniref:MBL fold metallo-hydrolase n=1 Tax=Actinomyces capricornis TaxID=2755559 RepID=UPI001CC4096B
MDSGLGTQDCTEGERRLGTRFVRLTHPALDSRETARAQVEALGIEPEAVESIVLTHLDVDHAGGLADFPWAMVHLSRQQYDLLDARAYPQFQRRLVTKQWDHDPHWNPIELTERYRGAAYASVSRGIGLVSLPGHLPGHCGVLVSCDHRADLIHAGDAFFSFSTLEGEPAPIGLRMFERMTRSEDAQVWRRSRRWLQERHREGIEVVCAHGLRRTR